MVVKSTEKSYFYYTVPLISISFLSLCFYFFYEFWELLKYQTNLDTHPLAALILMETHFRILIYQASQIIFMNLFLEDFQA